MFRTTSPLVGLFAVGLGLLACNNQQPQAQGPLPGPGPATMPGPFPETAPPPGRPKPTPPRAPEATTPTAPTVPNPRAPLPEAPRRAPLPEDPTRFRANRDGFGFENYGREKNPLDLTPAAVERLCGPGSCARGTGDTCVLSGAMSAFMRSVNSALEPGHCEGLSVLSQLIYMHYVPLNHYDSRATTTYQLPFNNNRLQSDIAYFAATMDTHPGGTSELKLTPNQILAELRKNQESYALGLYKRNGRDGHAVVAIRVVDENPRSSYIAIYDSNSPGAEQHIHVDPTNNTWNYEDYKGDASSKTLTLLPLTPRLAKQTCAPHGNDDEDEDENDFYGHRWQVWIDGAGSIDLPDGAQVISRRAAFKESSIEPIYLLKPQKDVELTLRAAPQAKPGKSNIVVLKHGQSLSLDGLTLEGNQVDKVKLSQDGNGFSYVTHEKESVVFRLGETYKKDDFEIEIYPAAPNGGFELQVDNVVDRVRGEHVLAVRLKNHNGKSASYGVEISRITDKGDEHFAHHDEVRISPGETHKLQYGKWLKDKQPMAIVTDQGVQTIDDED